MAPIKLSFVQLANAGFFERRFLYICKAILKSICAGIEVLTAVIADSIACSKGITGAGLLTAFTALLILVFDIFYLL
jgi:hypothetical protein